MRIDSSKLIVISLLVMWFSAAKVCAGEKYSPPDGWLHPGEEYLDNLNDWRSESKHLYQNSCGDFNGDGERDYAVIYISEDGLKEGLLVYLGGVNSGGEWQVLATTQLTPDQKAFMGMDKLPAGSYETIMCLNFDSDNQCIGDLKAQNDSILYFRPASSSRIFWWNDTDKSFHTFWYGE